MNELELFLSQFYGKYAPDRKVDSTLVQNVQSTYGNNYDKLITDLYRKYTPANVPDKSRLAKIKDHYRLQTQDELASAAERAPQPEGPGALEHLGKSIYAGARYDIPAAALGFMANSGGVSEFQMLEMDPEQIAELQAQGEQRTAAANSQTAKNEEYSRVYSEWLNSRIEQLRSKLTPDNQEKLNAQFATEQNNFLKQLEADLTKKYGEANTVNTTQKELFKAGKAAFDKVLGESRIKNKLELVLQSKDLKDKSAEYKKNLKTSLDQVHGVGDAIDWGLAAFGQSVSQIPLAVVSGGSSSLMQGIGNIYVDGITRVAEEKNIPIEQAIAEDDSFAPVLFGMPSALLDVIGAKGVMSAFSKKAFTDALKNKALQTIKTVATSGPVKEGATEGAQNVLEQIGISRMSDLSWEDSLSDIDWKEVGENFAQGMVGAAPLSAAGAVSRKLSDRMDEKRAKLNNQQAQQNIQEANKKVDELINQATGVVLPGSVVEYDQAGNATYKPGSQVEFQGVVAPDVAQDVAAKVDVAVADVTKTDDTLDVLADQLVAQQQEEADVKAVENQQANEETIEGTKTKVEAGKLSHEDDIESEKAFRYHIAELDEMLEKGEISQADFDTEMKELNATKESKETLKKKLAAEEAAKEAKKNEGKKSTTRKAPGVNKGVSKGNRGKAVSKPTISKPATSTTPAKPEAKASKLSLAEEQSLANEEFNLEMEERAEEKAKAPSKPAINNPKQVIKDLNKIELKRPLTTEETAKRKAAETQIKQDIVKPVKVEKTETPKVEDESDLGPAEPLYKPKKKATPKAPKKSDDSLKDLEKEVTSPSEKSKVKSMKAHRDALDAFEKKPTYEGIAKLKDAQKALEKEIEQGSKGDASYIEIRRELNKLKGRLEQLSRKKDVKDIVKEGKKAENKAKKEQEAKETSEETAKRQLKEELDQDDDISFGDDYFDNNDDFYDDAPKMGTKIREVFIKAKDTLTPHVYVPEASERNSIRHNPKAIGALTPDGTFISGDEFIEQLEYVDDHNIDSKIPDVRKGYKEDFKSALALANKLRAINGMPPVKVFISENPIFTRGGANFAGYYVGGKNSSIVLSKSQFIDDGTALHEAIHPITQLFAVISDLKISDPRYNSFKADLTVTFENAKSQVAKLIDDLLSDVTLDERHQALLEAIGVPDVDSFFDYLANSNIRNPKGRMGRLIYGLTNANEMVSEAFSNPSFANLLLHLKDEGSTRTANNSHTTLYKIAKNILDYLSDMYEKIFNTKGTTFGRVMDLMTEFEKAMSTGALQYDYLAETILRKEEVVGMEFKRADGKPLPANIAEKIVNRAIEDGILTSKDFKEYIGKLNLKLQAKQGKPLDRVQLKQLRDLFKKDVNIDNLLKDNRKAVMASLPNSTRYTSETHYTEQVNDFLEIKDEELEAKDKRKYYSVLKGLQKERITPEIARILTKYHGKRKVAVIEKSKGFGFRQLAASAPKYKNVAQIVTQMSKSMTEHADRLMETVYYDIMRANSRAELKTKAQVDELIDVVNKHGLQKKDYLRAGIMGVGLRTKSTPDIKSVKYLDEIKDNIKYLKDTQAEKLSAIKAGGEARWTEKDVIEENEIIAEFEKAFNEGKLDNFLNDNQKELFDTFRRQLEELRPAVKENTFAYWSEGKDTAWEEWYNYFPSRVAGRNDVAVLNDEAQPFQDIIMNEEKDYKNVSALQSRFTRRFSKNHRVYLDLNVLSVANAYHKAVNYDLHATKYLRMLNAMLRTKAVAEKDMLGARNVQVIRDSLVAHVRAVTGRNYNFNKIVKAAEDIKATLVTTKLGTTGQFATQLVAQLPAIATFGNPANFSKAASDMMHFEQKYGKSFDAWIAEHGAGLQIRDMFFEIEQTVTQFAKSKVSGTKLGEIREFADTSTRKVLTWSDKVAARLMFMTAFIEAGGDFSNPTKEALAHAERKTILSQNVSDLSFAPTMFRPDTSIGRVVLSMAMPFKSFAWQQMLNSYNALRDAPNSPEARKMFAANVLSSLGYATAQALVVKTIYGWLASAFAYVGSGVASSVGAEALAAALEARDDEDEEKSYGTLEGIAANTAYDIFFSGLPLIADKFLKEGANEAIYSKIGEARTGNKFDSYKDSPLVTSKDMMGLFGGYEDMLRLGKTTATLPVQWTTHELAEAITGRQLKDQQMKISDWYKLAMVDAMSFMRLVPFRGDIVKANRELVQELKEYEREEKQAAKRSSSRRKLNRRKLTR
jgi:hypothetical protein